MVHVEDIRGQQRLNDKRPVLHTFNQGIVKQAFMRRMLIDKIECVPGLKNEIGIQSLSDDADFSAALVGGYSISVCCFSRASSGGTANVGTGFSCSGVVFLSASARSSSSINFLFSKNIRSSVPFVSASGTAE